jgi:hypothetical protein
MHIAQKRSALYYQQFHTVLEGGLQTLSFFLSLVNMFHFYLNLYIRYTICFY